MLRVILQHKRTGLHVVDGTLCIRTVVTRECGIVDLAGRSLMVSTRRGWYARFNHEAKLLSTLNQLQYQGE